MVRGTWEEFGGWEYFEGTLRREFGRCIHEIRTVGVSALQFDKDYEVMDL